MKETVATMFPSLPLSVLKSGILFTCSAASTVVALHFPIKFHRFFLLPTWAFAACSIASINGEATPIGVFAGLDTYTVITSFLFMLILPTILFMESNSLTPEHDASAAKAHRSCSIVWPSWGSIAAACRVWNNPRNLKFRNPPRPSSAAWPSLLRFAFFRGFKVMSIILVDQWIVQRAHRHLFTNGDLLDFTPDQHPVIRPILHQLFFGNIEGKYGPISKHFLQLRAFMSVSWIWANFQALELCHAVLSVLFVFVLRLDNPEDWPPLFGSILDVWSVRRFWSRFWHRIATPSLTRWAWICLGGRGKPRTALEKTAVAFNVFLLSGVMHATAAWRTDQRFAGLDVLFFCANFLIIGVEIVITRFYSRAIKGTRLHETVQASRLFCAAGRALGFVWVFAWFFWAVPRWLYPKTLRMLIKAALIQARNSS